MTDEQQPQAQPNSDTPPPESQLDRAGRLFREGRELLNKNKPVEAVAKLEAAINASPAGKEMPFAFAALGRALMVQGQYEAAQPHLEKAVSMQYMEQDKLQYRVDLASNLAHLGRHQEAVEEYARILRDVESMTKEDRGKSNLSVADIYNREGISFAHLTRDEDAAAAFASAVDLEPDNVEYRKNMMSYMPVLKTMNERAQAQEYAAIALDMIRESEGRHADGVLSLAEEAFALQPGNEENKKLLDLVRQAMKKPAPPVEDPEKRFHLAAAFNGAGNYIVQRYGDFDAVRSLWEKAFALAPDDISVRYNMSISCYDREQYAESDDHINAALQGLSAVPEPEKEEHKEGLRNFIVHSEVQSALVQSRLGRHEAAIFLLQDKFGKDRQITPGMCHAYGVSLAALGRKDEAVRYLEMAVNAERTRARKDEYRDSLKAVTGSGQTENEKMMETLMQQIKNQAADGPSIA